MKYAKVNYLTNQDVLKGKKYYYKPTFDYIMADSEEELRELAIEECENVQRFEFDRYIYEMKITTAEEFNDNKKFLIENKIKDDYWRVLCKKKNTSVKEHMEYLIDIDEYNKALEYFLRREKIKRDLSRRVDETKITLKEFNDYLDELYKIKKTKDYYDLLGNIFNRFYDNNDD